MRGNCVEVARATNPEFVALVVEERRPPVGQRLRYSLSDSDRGMHCLFFCMYSIDIRLGFDFSSFSSDHKRDWRPIGGPVGYKCENQSINQSMML